MQARIRVLVVLALVMVMALTVAGGVMAQNNTKFPAYISGIQVANLQNSPATVVVQAYNPDGSQNGNALQDTIPANDSITYFPLSSVSQGFSGSVIISSDAEIAAISNILSSDFAAGGSYVGRSAGDTTVSLPILNQNNGGFTTWFSVQNASTEAAQVSVEYTDGTNGGPARTVQPGAATVFYQNEETHSQSNFAGTVTSDKPVVAAVIQESDSIIFSYTGFTGGSINPVFPLVNANNAGYVTGIQIQNAGGEETTVTVSYTPSSVGTACTETQAIPAGEAGTFAFAAFADGSNSNCVPGETFVGSARVTANSTSQPLVGVGNQLSGGNGEAYVSFAPDSATNKVVMPLIMDRNGGFFTGFNLANVGDSATTVNCSFSGTDYSVSGTLEPGEALTSLQGDQISAGYVGSATCEATDADAKLVAVVNQLGNAAGADQFLVYEGVNVNP